MKFLEGENWGESQEKPAQDLINAPQTPHGVTKTRIQDPNSEGRSLNCLGMELSPSFQIVVWKFTLLVTCDKKYPSVAL
mgnify:CR=1 FL=1